MLLAAAAATPAPTAGFDPLTALYVLVGSAAVALLGRLAYSLLKWLGARTIQNEDQAKQSVRETLKEHSTQLDELDHTLSGLDKAIGSVAADAKQCGGAMESIRGQVAEIRANLDTRLEKQGEFYRALLKEQTAQYMEKLEELERTIRQDTMRSIHDATTVRATRKR